MAHLSEQTASRLVSAIRNAGSHPRYHFAKLEELRQEWPTLHDAVMAAVTELEHQ
ncbi:hypothetical protein KNU02_gp80 [Gordonia phage Pleakley]|uniref:Uncharacterized protein n=1 Tax=Gordonia phage Pleakley TaxID=2283246 RepID=A0A345M6J8_9CAUD|nr:hypothetical protein KNU02_gp80 [Gordonia phage Pleakley]AXH49805.1 hypothetical protein SEA_FURY_80 [Gordonia phage Fury]AXH66119.1 hypothetical protein SEA_PLEAKLEY_80 [Gordonia phage Pleakley]